MWQVLAALQRKDEALTALRAACRALPADLSLKRTLAAFLANAGRRVPDAGQEAIQLAMECCQVEPENAQNFDMLAIAHAAVGDFPSAIEAARQALDLASDGDLVVCLGAGNITQWANALPAEMAALLDPKAEAGE